MSKKAIVSFVAISVVAVAAIGVSAWLYVTRNSGGGGADVYQLSNDLRIETRESSEKLVKKLGEGFDGLGKKIEEGQATQTDRIIGVVKKGNDEVRKVVERFDPNTQYPLADDDGQDQIAPATTAPATWASSNASSNVNASSTSTATVPDAPVSAAGNTMTSALAPKILTNSNQAAARFVQAKVLIALIKRFPKLLPHQLNEVAERLTSAQQADLIIMNEEGRLAEWNLPNITHVNIMGVSKAAAAVVAPPPASQTGQ